MTPSPCRLPAAIVVGLCLIAGCGDSAGGDSPEEVYKAATTASKNNDYRTYSNYLTPASLDQLAIGLLSSAEAADAGRKSRGSRPAPDAEEDRQWEKIQQVFHKHKINLADLEAPPDIADSADAAVVIRASIDQRKRVIDQIEDKPGFVHDMMEVYRRPDDEERAKAAPEWKLTDVKIDGTKATAKLRFEHEGKEHASPVNFRSIDGEWKIDEEPSGKE